MARSRQGRWAASEQLIPATVPQGLAKVDGLRAGKSAAREPRKVHPVADERVDAIFPNVSAVVAAMIRLQRLTGMRPGEVCAMRLEDVDRSGDAWTYCPAVRSLPLYRVPRGPDPRRRVDPPALRPLRAGVGVSGVVRREIRVRASRCGSPLQCASGSGYHRLANPAHWTL